MEDDDVKINHEPGTAYRRGLSQVVPPCTPLLWQGRLTTGETRCWERHGNPGESLTVRVGASGPVKLHVCDSHGRGWGGAYGEYGAEACTHFGDNGACRIVLEGTGDRSVSFMLTAV